MWASAVLRVHRAYPRHHHLPHDPTIGSLLRQRLQTSLDGVVCELPSEQLSSASALRHSRNGLVALFGWIAAVSYFEGSASQPPTSHISGAQTALLSASLRGSSSASRPFPTGYYTTASSTRRLHTSSSAKQQSTRRLQDSVLSDSRGQSSHSTAASSTLHWTAKYGSLAHSHSSHDSWLDRLGLSFLRSSSSQNSEQSSRITSGQQGAQAAKKVDRSAEGKGRIYDHIRHPSLYDPVVAPRYPIVLCHGLYGFDVRGPFFGLEIHYWANVLDILRKRVGADVLIHGVPPTGSIQSRAEALHRFLCSNEAGVRGQKLNFIGHSMGGLDVRHLIANIKPKLEEYIPVSLTTVSTPHRGSPFMDWCNANIGIGNEYIEKAIEEARANRANSALQSGKRNGEPVRLPYSLKAPLFSRPNNDKRSGEGRTSPALEPAPAKQGQDASSPTSSGDKDISSSVEAAGVAAASAVLEAVDRAAEAVGISQSRGDDESHRKVREGENKVADSVKESVKSNKGGSSLPFGLSSFAKALSSLSGSFSAYMLSLLDTPAYAMLSTRYMAEVFNPATPNSPDVKYYSVAARTPSLAIWHPLWLPKLILDAAAESRTVGGESDGSADALGGQNQGNDGLVSVKSAKWGEFLGIMEGCDHWDLRGGGAPRWKGKVNPATGKPYQSKAEMAGKAEALSASQQQKEDDSASWASINQLLFSGRSDTDKGTRQGTADAKRTEDGGQASAASAKSPRNYAAIADEAGWAGVSLQDADHEETPAVLYTEGMEEDESGSGGVGSSFTSQNDDLLVTDIAAWISDRLPERNIERRAQAAERDRLISEMSLTLYHPVTAGLTDGSGPASSQQQQQQRSMVMAEGPGSDASSLLSSASSSQSGSASSARTAGISTLAIASDSTVAGRQESAGTTTKPETGSGDATFAASSFTSTKAKAKPAPQPDELERFWVALCRHLRVEGF